MSLALVHVRVLDEEVDLWRAVAAHRVGRDRYRIFDDEYDESVERWEFVPGQTVGCVTKKVRGRQVLFAVELASETLAR